MKHFFLHKDTKWTYNTACCEKEFLNVLKDDQSVRDCIGLCKDPRMLKLNSRMGIPSVCDPVKKIPDQKCKMKMEMMP